MITVAAETNFIEDVLNEQYIQDINELPSSIDLKPDMVWQPSDWSDRCKRDKSPYFIFGWVDIVGYRNATKIDGQFYINESPENAAIIQYKSYSCVFLPVFKLPIKNTVEVYQEGNQLVAKLTVTQTMFSIYTGYYSWYNLTQTFYDREILPSIYSISDKKLNVSILQFNTTGYEAVIINVRNQDNIDRINYFLPENKTATHILRLARINYTNKNVAFTDMQLVDIWAGNASRQGDNIVIPGNISNKDIIVSGSNIYQKFDANYTFSKQEYHPENALFNPAFIAFILIILLCLFIMRQILI